MKVYVILNPATGAFSKGGFYPKWSTSLSGAKLYKRLSDVKKVIRSRPGYWQKQCYDFSSCLILEYNISTLNPTSIPAAQFILK